MQDDQPLSKNDQNLVHRTFELDFEVRIVVKIRLSSPFSLFDVDVYARVDVI